jgi:DNA (cytosine-5)-methyltransferase 1
VLDAQNFGVAQRRRRVFVVGCLGSWKSAAEVLFESESLSGNIKQGRKKRESVAGYVESSFGQYREDVIAGTTKASGGVLGGGSETFLTIPIHAQATQYSGGGDNRNNDGKGNGLGIGKPGDPMNTLDTSSRHAVATSFNVNARPDEMKFLEEQSNALTVSQNSGVAIDIYNLTTNKNTSQTIRNGTDIDHVGGLMKNMVVRRLTEIECERLQGFPDNYTNIKENCPSGARYKALGNSMAVPVMKWIGERINAKGI